HRDRASQTQSKYVDDHASDTETCNSAPAASVKDLPQIADGQANSQGELVHHALVIGLGGTGAECVRELRHRIAELHVASPLHLHSMVIDTDLSTIHALRLGEVSDRVPKCNSVYTPLRTAHEYRDAGTNRLKSISRRWIYNVPRSGSTEGMRPLGRLALVDHGKMVRERLVASIEEMVSECGSIPPKIYVVGSLAGGTGSGMYIDVVHLLRSMLDDSGLEEVRILSLLSSVGFHIDHANPLALHDAQAALNEIGFFMQVGNGYPGDEGAGWPSVPAARTPLRDLYLICGASADQLASNPVETITEYVWGDSTGCGDLLAAARRYEQSDSPSIRKPSIRSVGVIPLGDRHGVETRVLSPAVVRELLTRWLGVPSKARKASPDLAVRFARRLSLSLEHTIETLKDHLDVKSLPGPSVGAIETFVAEQIKAGDLDWVSAGWLNNIYREISVCLNDRRADVSTVFESLKILNDRCLEWSRHAMQSAPSPVGAEDAVVADAIYIDAIVKRLSAHQLEQFASGLTFLEERLERLAAILAVGVVETKNEMREFNPWDSMPEVVRNQFDGVVKQLHSDTVGQCLIRPMNDMGANLDARSLISELTELAVPIVVEMVERHSAEVAKARVGGLNVEQADQATTSVSHTASQSGMNRTAQTHEVTMTHQPRVVSGPMSIDDAIVCVKPTLLSLGGLQRLILVVGSEVERSQLEPQVREIHQGSLTVAVIPNTEPKLIHEAQKIELKDIMSRLAVLNGANEQVTSRLASRVDVAF
ncbi:MAG: tubulin-like doman-containing protein, partial [Rubripirellula sp.]